MNCDINKSASYKQEGVSSSLSPHNDTNTICDNRKQLMTDSTKKLQEALERQRKLVKDRDAELASRDEEVKELKRKCRELEEMATAQVGLGGSQVSEKKARVKHEVPKIVEGTVEKWKSLTTAQVNATINQFQEKLKAVPLAIGPTPSHEKGTPVWNTVSTVNLKDSEKKALARAKRHLAGWNAVVQQAKQAEIHQCFQTMKLALDWRQLSKELFVRFKEGGMSADEMKKRKLTPLKEKSGGTEEEAIDNVYWKALLAEELYGMGYRTTMAAQDQTFESFKNTLPKLLNAGNFLVGLRSILGDNALLYLAAEGGVSLRELREASKQNIKAALDLISQEKETLMPIFGVPTTKITELVDVDNGDAGGEESKDGGEKENGEADTDGGIFAGLQPVEQEG